MVVVLHLLFSEACSVHQLLIILKVILFRIRFARDCRAITSQEGITYHKSIDERMIAF